MNRPSLETLHARERQSWRDSATEGVHADTVDGLLHKMSEARVFLEGVRRYPDFFQGGRTFLELGGGEGWASCLLARILPGPRELIASDIAETAIAAAPRWERVFGVTLDRRFTCVSDAIPLEDASVDRVFAFQAAHHFRTHRRTLQEIRRILRPGGACLYLHEPACLTYAYPIYQWRSRRVGGDGPEDVIVTSRLLRVATDEGFRARSDRDLTLTHRGPSATLYYLAQRILPPLRLVLPGTRNFLFEKIG